MRLITSCAFGRNHEESTYWSYQKYKQCLVLRFSNSAKSLEGVQIIIHDSIKWLFNICRKACQVRMETFSCGSMNFKEVKPKVVLVPAFFEHQLTKITANP